MLKWQYAKCTDLSFLNEYSRNYQSSVAFPTIIRTNLGDNTTMGYFTATAYDDHGQFITSITGVTLEPNYDAHNANVGGSGTAIAPGTYQVVSETYHDTKGCILLGSSGTVTNGDYIISGSTSTVESFNELLSKHGNNGITLIIQNVL